MCGRCWQWRAIQRFSKYPLIVLTNTTTFPDGQDVAAAFCALGAQMLPVQEVPLSDRLRNTFGQPNYIAAWKKLQIFRFEQFEKIIWMDGDGFLGRSVDYLFDLPGMWAETFSNSSTEYLCAGTKKQLNGCFLVLEPAESTYQGLLKFAESQTELYWAEQDLIERYFRDHLKQPWGFLDPIDGFTGKCFGKVPVSIAELFYPKFNQSDIEAMYHPGSGFPIPSLPAFVHKAGGYGACWTFNVEAQIFDYHGVKRNLCHTHSTGLYFRELFCGAVSVAKISDKRAIDYCNDKIWYRAEGLPDMYKTEALRMLG